MPKAHLRSVVAVSAARAEASRGEASRLGTGWRRATRRSSGPLTHLIYTLEKHVNSFVNCAAGSIRVSIKRRKPWAHFLFMHRHPGARVHSASLARPVSDTLTHCAASRTRQRVALCDRTRPTGEAQRKGRNNAGSASRSFVENLHRRLAGGLFGSPMGFALQG
jgi:hypothetical protein